MEKTKSGKSYSVQRSTHDCTFILAVTFLLIYGSTVQQKLCNYFILLEQTYIQLTVALIRFI